MTTMNGTTTAQLLLQPLDDSHYYIDGGVGVGDNDHDDDNNDYYYSYSLPSTSASTTTTVTSNRRRHHYYRSLATLRMPSDGNYSDDNEMEDASMDWYSYTPVSTELLALLLLLLSSLITNQLSHSFTSSTIVFYSFHLLFPFLYIQHSLPLWRPCTPRPGLDIPIVWASLPLLPMPPWTMPKASNNSHCSIW
jgi:hypothetical protein